ncbi:MAG TPA: tetratricopeptide repeat protein, partial [Steroidobacteraceae bacterium]|nr:tetratricopeptide repeat protein [Steroidobacteraceae bacterium]
MRERRSLGRVRRHAGVALACILLSACGLFMSPERRIERAEDMMQKGDYGSAVIELRNALDEQPDNAKGRLLLARAAVQIGDLLTADKEIARAIELGAEADEATPLAAEIKLGLGQFDQLEKLVQPPATGLSEAERLIYLGYAQLRTDRVGQALGTFQAAAAADPKGDVALRAQTGLAEAHARSGDIDAALRELDAVLAVNPRFFDARLAKGMLLVQRGDVQAAEAVLADMALTDAGSAVPKLKRISALTTLVEAQLAQGNDDAAAKSLGQLKELAPKTPLVSYLSARIALARGDAPAAVIEMQRVVQASPNFIPARFLLGQALAATNNLGQAEKELQAVVQAEPENVEARKMLADIQIRSGRASEAVESLSPL